MNRQKAIRLSKRWPEWMKRWKEEAIKKSRKDLPEDVNYFENLYEHAIRQTKNESGMIEWFIHCLYKRGYKIVPKRGVKE